jgi:putative RNA 2'-phosphotransferase
VRERLRELSRAASHALRHEPWLYGIELDEGGWTSITSLAAALNAQVDDLLAMAVAFEKRRFELDGDRIRAAYGHSLPERVQREQGAPPNELFHGTDPAVVARILEEGLTPRARQYVHLSVDRAMAAEVGRRKAARPVVLRIRSADAHADGIAFYIGNDRVWLADHVPPRFITLD